MAVVNPAAFLQNAGSTHTAQVTRIALAGMSSTARSAGSLTPRGGVHNGLGVELFVTQQSSPAMGITVNTGMAYVPGSEASSQGMYACMNSTATDVTVTAAHASLARIDIVVFRVYDTAYSGALNQCALEVIAGTPSGSPVAPAAPNNSLVLAQIFVGAGVTSIVNANLTDVRVYMPTGVIPVTNQTELAALIGFDGLGAYVKAEDTVYWYNGTSWLRDPKQGVPVSIIASASSSGAIGTTGTVVQTCPSATYKANTCYKLTIEWGHVMSTTTNFPVVQVKKTDASGAVVIDFACRPTNGTAGVAIGDEMSRLFIVGGSDVTAALAAVISTLAGTVTVSAASTRPRIMRVEEFGKASDYPTSPTLS